METSLETETAVIILDSDDEDSSALKATKIDDKSDKPAIKRSASNVNGSDSPEIKIRRINPTKIGELDDDTVSRPKDSPFNNQEEPGIEESNTTKDAAETNEVEGDPQPGPSKPRDKEAGTENELTTELKNLIRACRRAEPSTEMKQVIKTKLLKYYHSVHPDYVISKRFKETLKETTQDIDREPHLVYSKLKQIIEELDVRRKSKATVFNNGEAMGIQGTGDETKDAHLKKLHKALLRAKRTILDLEEAEVDWDDDDNSAYVKKVRWEKRAVDIYKKICELTGESSHAHRIVKKPITFKGTDFPAFNKKLQKMVNNKGSFPNFMKVLQCLDLCNRSHKFGLTQDQIKRIAQDAFEKLGKKLQERRRTDLYETTTFYLGAANAKDPAKDNPELRVQLEKNKKFYARIDDMINEFAEKESKAQSDDAEEVSSTSKTEPTTEVKEVVEEMAAAKVEDLKTSGECDKNDATSLNDDVIEIS